MGSETMTHLLSFPATLWHTMGTGFSMSGFIFGGVFQEPIKRNEIFKTRKKLLFTTLQLAKFKLSIKMMTRTQ